jgi:hypothetical protein
VTDRASTAWRRLLGPRRTPFATTPADDPPAPPRTTPLEWAGFLACLALFLGLAGWYYARIGTSVVDDAFIFLRYADRLVHGEGLTFTPGPPVEGYTSLLWTLLLAAGHLLPLEPLQLARLAGLALSVGTLVAVWRAARLLVPGPVSLVAVALLALNRSLALWSVEALDTALFTCCLAAALWAWLRHGTRLVRGIPLAGLCFGLLALARPEGLLFAALAGLFAGLAAWRSGTLRRFAVHAACAAAFAAGQLAFRLLEYGELLPNTFHAKVQGAQLARGLDYLLLWARENLVVLAAALAVAGTLRLLQTSARRAQVLWLASGLVAYLAYVALVGGDFFEFRLLVPTLPPAALLTAAGVEAVRRRIPRPHLATAAAAALAVALLAASAWAVAVPHRNDPHCIRPDQPSELAAFGWFERTARWLACNIDPRETLALRPAGVIPYLTGAGALDMLGLTDREIARAGRRIDDAAVGHQRVASPDYVRRRGATYLVGHPVRSDRPLDDPTLVSAEVAPGEWLILLPLHSAASLRPGTYPLRPTTTILDGWRPRTSGGRCVPYNPSDR